MNLNTQKTKTGVKPSVQSRKQSESVDARLEAAYNAWMKPMTEKEKADFDRVDPYGSSSNH